jgi:ATP-dependent protease ClpP protease subunit
MTIEINLEGVIYSFMVQEIREEINKANGEDLKINIASPGGFVYPGLLLYNVLNNYSGQVHTHLMSVAASMASVIAMAGDLVTAESASVFMIHNASMYDGGDYRDFKKHADYLEKMTDMLARIYADKTGKSVADIRVLMDDETYLFGNEMKTAGFVDEVIDSKKKTTKNEAVTFARLAVADCLAEMKAHDTEKDDLEKAAALLPEAAIDNKPRNNADKTKKTEVKKTMDLQTFLAENPTAKAAFDAEMKINFDAGFKAGTEDLQAKVNQVTPYMVDKEGKPYPVAVKNLAVDVLEGKAGLDALKGAITVLDAQTEQNNSAAAAGEGGAETPPQNHDTGGGSEDGNIRNEEDYNAGLERIKES